MESAGDMYSNVTVAKSLLRKRLCTHDVPPAIFGYESERRCVAACIFLYLLRMYLCRVSHYVYINANLFSGCH